jgi:hypothetical protein
MPSDLHNSGIEHAEPATMGSNSIDPSAMEEPASAATKNYASLDAKLKALDEAQDRDTAPTKISKSKKRKSGGQAKDALFKPTQETEDDDEFAETPRKKRKSGGGVSSSPQGKRSSVTATSNSPSSKKTTNGTAKKAKSKSKKQPIPEPVSETEQYGEDEPAPGTNDAYEAPARTSLDSQGIPLEPVYEEEEEIAIVPLKGDPVKPSAKATPARYGRLGGRSRSGSPHKRAGSVQAGPEETMITRAAEVAQERRSEDGGSATRSVGVVAKEAKVMVKKRKGGAQAGQTGEFEWPEDVF